MDFSPVLLNNFWPKISYINNLRISSFLKELFRVYIRKDKNFNKISLRFLTITSFYYFVTRIWDKILLALCVHVQVNARRFAEFDCQDHRRISEPGGWHAEARRVLRDCDDGATGVWVPDPTNHLLSHQSQKPI